jgi:hypothetical protein
MWRLASPRSWCPSSPSQTLGTPFSHCLSRPSTLSSQLCRAQQVRNILSAGRCPCKQIPVFRMRNQPFIIPNVHSTSLRVDSSHCEKRISGRLQDAFIGGTVVAQFRYPLSTITHAPEYFCFTTLPCVSIS